ncbi:MAG TPA: FtsW/RodA/SpoVE family cell cycle protein, partial [Phytomonospora sp.]
MSERSQPLAALRGLLDRPLASYYLLLSSAGLLVLIGLVMVFSATMVEAYAEVGSSFAAIAKQATWAVVGVFGFWFAQRLPVRTYRGIGRPLLVASAILLAVLVVFPYINAGPLRTEGDDQGLAVHQPADLAGQRAAGPQQRELLPPLPD